MILSLIKKRLSLIAGSLEAKCVKLGAWILIKIQLGSTSFVLCQDKIIMQVKTFRNIYQYSCQDKIKLVTFMKCPNKRQSKTAVAWYFLEYFVLNGGKVQMTSSSIIVCYFIDGEATFSRRQACHFLNFY